MCVSMYLYWIIKCQHLEDLYNSVNEYYPTDQCNAVICLGKRFKAQQARGTYILI